jgi:hypothetical protein
METRSEHRGDAWSRRPVFVPRQVLTAEQLNAGLDDALARQRLLNRAMHGTGVVFGLALAVDGQGRLATERGSIEIGCGLALDRHGRMLYWPGGRLALDHLVGQRPCSPGPYTLRIHYAEEVTPPTRCGPCADDEARWREQGVVFSLRPDCDETAACCAEHPPGACISHEEYVALRIGALEGALPASADLDRACAAPGPLCRTECGDRLYDPDAWIPLACVEICDLRPRKPRDGQCPGADDTRDTPGGDVQPGGGGAGKPPDHDENAPEPGETHPDPSCLGFCPTPPEVARHRRYVYRAPLLYDLLRCCDVELPRVSRVSWQEWLEGGWGRRVPWDDFAARISHTGSDPEAGFAVWFTRPIRIATLHPGSVILRAIVQTSDTDYWEGRRIPLHRLHAIDKSDDGEYAGGVLLEPEEDWIKAEITGRRSSLFYGTRIEITLRGQVLRDACNRMLDARPLDIDGCGRCQARPGDDFVIVFRVGPRAGCEDHDHDPWDEPDQIRGADPGRTRATDSAPGDGPPEDNPPDPARTEMTRAIPGEAQPGPSKPQAEQAP